MRHFENDNKRNLRFLSVCSGIEAASVAWGQLGWKAIGFAEIDKAASAVLAHYYPDVPNYGDMTKFKEWPDLEVDILCGGTPCQSFSVAGMREGLKDPRGNLTLTFLGIAEKYNPEWIVWENVPGILSDKTGALISFLDGLEELGYVVDVDILDAQYFGLAQRRRRVVVCAQNIKHILNRKTISSALTIAQCLQETSRLTLDVLTTQSTGAQLDSISSETSALHSLRRRMKLFGLHSETGQAQTSVESLVGHLKLLEQERSVLGLGSGKEIASRCGGTKSQGSSVVTEPYQEGSEFTERSWQSTLVDPLQTMSECITSTSSKGTTESKIYSCALMTLRIGALMHQSMDSSPVFWSAATSSLTAMKEFINYARQASSNLFTGVEWVRSWSDFVKQAIPVVESLERIRLECFGEVFPISESVFRNPPARGEAGQGVAPTLSARTKGGGGLGTDFDLDGGLVEAFAIQERPVSENLKAGPDGKGFHPDIAYTLEARSNVQSVAYAPEIARCVATREGSSQDFESTTMVAVGVSGDISHALKPEGADASEDGTGRGTPIIAFDTTQITSKANYSNPKPGDPCHPLAAGAHPPAVTVALRGREGGATAELGGEVATALRASSGGGDKPHVLACRELAGAITSNYGKQLDNSDTALGPNVAIHHSAVRRLTPRECERLMGFPDDYTRIPVRRYDKPRITRLRPADMWSQRDGEWWLMAADGPRYKQLGNSWAVPKFRWLGERIARFMPAAATAANDNKQDSKQDRNAAAA